MLKTMAKMGVNVWALFVVAATLLSAVSAAGAQQSSRAIRILVDPATGLRWKLIANPACPEGPGMFVPDGFAPPSATAHPVPGGQHLVRAGERLVINESTPNLVARYTAVALAPAARGDVIFARLTAETKPVRVVVLDPGRAAFVSAVVRREDQP